MLTTCPECHTAFRVGQAQLDSRRGLVRCGRCNAVFNAYDSLLPELESPEGEVAGLSRPPAVRDALGQPASAGDATVQPAAGRAAADIDLQLPSGEKEAATLPVHPAQPEEPLPVPPADEETTDSILLSELPIQRGHAREPDGWRSVAWGFAALLLGGVLLVQVAYFMRGEWVAWFPQARPYFLQACAMLGCEVPLPEDIESLRIEASSLETNPDDRRHAMLRFSISNRADQAMAWPHIVVNLTDADDRVTVRKVFAPTQYLPGASKPRSGIAPGQEQEIQLNLEFNGVEPFGYRIEKRYF